MSVEVRCHGQALSWSVPFAELERFRPDPVSLRTRDRPIFTAPREMTPIVSTGLSGMLVAPSAETRRLSSWTWALEPFRNSSAIEREPEFRREVIGRYVPEDRPPPPKNLTPAARERLAGEIDRNRAEIVRHEALAAAPCAASVPGLSRALAALRPAWRAYEARLETAAAAADLLDRIVRVALRAWATDPGGLDLGHAPLQVDAGAGEDATALRFAGLELK